MTPPPLPGHRILRSESIAPGLPVEKYVDARPVESFTWRSPLQLATYQDLQRGLKMAFHYAERSRLPRAVTIQSGQGQAVYRLGFDQVGSLKAVASQEADGALRVVKVVDYDSFGNVLSDSNPGLFLPLGFAGGLRDRFTGLVRFCHRDYDPTVGRFTAQDPLGDTGGDHDPYDYCVDEPVGRVDPEGLFLVPLIGGLLGLAGATGLAWGGVKTAQKGAEVAAESLGDDKLKAELPEKVEAMDKGATDAMTTVTGINAGIGATAAAGAAAAEAAPVIGSAALDPKNIEFAQDFIAGTTNTPPIMTPGGVTGAAASKAADLLNIGERLKKSLGPPSTKVQIEDFQR